MFNTINDSKAKQAHQSYVRYLTKKQSGVFLLFARHLKALKNLCGDDGYMFVRKGIANIEWANGRIRFPLIENRRTRVLPQASGGRVRLPTVQAPDGYYTIIPEKIMIKLRYLDDPNRHRFTHAKPYMDKTHLSYCCDLEKDQLEPLLELAKKAHLNDGNVYFAATRAYHQSYQIAYSFNLRKHVGFSGRTFKEVVNHMLCSASNTWSVYKIERSTTKTAYIIFGQLPRDQDLWNNCILLLADDQKSGIYI